MDPLGDQVGDAHSRAMIRIAYTACIWMVLQHRQNSQCGHPCCSHLTSLAISIDDTHDHESDPWDPWDEDVAALVQAVPQLRTLYLWNCALSATDAGGISATQGDARFAQVWSLEHVIVFLHDIMTVHSIWSGRVAHEDPNSRCDAGMAAMQGSASYHNSRGCRP